MALGGAAICPGDAVAADGDGVIDVPGNAAVDAAVYTSGKLRNDEANHRAKYEALGVKPDKTM